MNRLSLKYILLLINLYCFHSISGQISENIIIQTDRDIYISGESVWYKANCLKTGSNIPSVLSKVLYMELLNSKNIPVVQFKLFLENGEINSKFVLPDTLSSGVYVITGYTNWMKNFGPSFFSRKLISVINPFRREKYSGINIGFLRNKLEPYVKRKPSYAVNSIEDSYKPRSLVKIDIQKQGDIRYSSISVVRNSLIIDSKESFTGSNLGGNSDAGYQKRAGSVVSGYLPEMEGEIISGIIKFKSDNRSVSNKIIALNFVVKEPSMYISKTDSLGTFRFMVNKTGEQVMVIQPLDQDTTDIQYNINLDPAFFPDTNKLAIYYKQLNDSSIDCINKSIISMQVNAIYNPVNSRNHTSLNKFPDISFYSYPEMKVDIPRYIELPTVNEVFKELVPSVLVRERKGNYFFKVIEESGYPTAKTTVLMDGVIIKNINKIFEMNPLDIRKIEVINLDYFLKGQDLGSIISFQTNKGDLSAFDFDNRVFRQDFSGYEFVDKFSSPDYSVDSSFYSTNADFRNLLFWNPDIPFDKTGSVTVKFYTSDESGNYIVNINGINSRGETEHYEVPFSVVSEFPK